jgi:hypothetical protein
MYLGAHSRDGYCNFAYFQHLVVLIQILTSHDLMSYFENEVGALPWHGTALPRIETALPCIETALPCIEGALPCIEGALPCIEGALPWPEGALPRMRWPNPRPIFIELRTSGA